MNKVFELPPEFNKTVLPNGVRVITEHHPNTRATCAGIFVPFGSRDEPSNLVGAAHFVEHMVFKGTKKHTAFQLVANIEAVGGELNAYTSREYTCFHAATLREHLPIALDVLTDLVSNAVFDEEEFEKERQVILAEIDMSADDLDEYIFDIYFEKVFNQHSLSRPILGTPKSLGAITRDKLFEFYKNRYSRSDIIVSIAGAVDHDEAVRMVAEALGDINTSNESPVEPREAPEVVAFQEFKMKSSEQVHLLLGQKSSSYKDPFRFESYIANAALGGGMTSRLYQKIREEKGLAYSVYSYLHAFTDSGLMMVYSGTSKENAKQCLKMMHSEFKSMMEKGITEKELEFFKRQVLGTILLGSDDIENRMNSLGVNEMVFGKYRPVETVLEEIQSVTTASMTQFFKKYMDENQYGVYILGDLSAEEAADLLLDYV